MTGWETAWVMWGMFFLAIELPAAINKIPGDTLTEHIQRLAAISGKPTWWLVRRALLVLFLVWLGLHLFRVLP